MSPRLLQVGPPALFLMKIPLTFLVGPTASGKSDVALPLAQRLNAEIISIDSMQIYRGMDIGTAKPSLEVRQLVPHHLIDICDPWEQFNTAMFVELAHAKIQEIYSRGKKILLVGGTALYIKNLLEGIFPGPSANWEIRRQLMQKPVELLYAELGEIDPVAAQKIYAQDLRRIIRALEVYYTTGIPISTYQKEHTPKNESYEPSFVGIAWEKSLLIDRINRRVEEMVENGLIVETQKLLGLPQPLSHTAAQAIGYREVIAALREPELLPKLTETIQINTRHFAKRQMTWLKRFPVAWVAAYPGVATHELLEKSCALLPH